ncbi:MAG TPA: Sec-independent protein translocase protein TatB [Xanthobacteraceae bacterium]|jgi:sec-independent protein translocase protein TatB|nr:Sec-independent protein translocase protein TatB [Xanthobacteraceae bacterium]
MFDISWTEFLLIGIVALIVIGPKELPAVMRSLGQWTRKIRSLAADFQNQFHEAMREAEMADLKKQVDDMAQVAQDIKQYDPLKDVRADVEAIGKDLDESVKSPDKATNKDTAEATDSAATAPPAEALPIPQAASEVRDKEVAGADVGPVAPEAPAESTPSGGEGKPQ